MWWHRVAIANPSNRMLAFCYLWEFFGILYCCFVATGRSPEILIDFNHLLPHTKYPFDCDNIKYEMSPQILHHVISL